MLPRVRPDSATSTWKFSSVWSRTTAMRSSSGRCALISILRVKSRSLPGCSGQGHGESAGGQAGERQAASPPPLSLSPAGAHRRKPAARTRRESRGREGYAMIALRKAVRVVVPGCPPSETPAHDSRRPPSEVDADTSIHGAHRHGLHECSPRSSHRPAAPAASGVVRGWQKVSMPALGSYFELYVPNSWDGTTALPLVVFLHGAGGNPEEYFSNLGPPAEGVRCVVAAPKSSSEMGWGLGNDDQIIAATSVTVASMLPVDPSRVSIAGHSAGGAEAYLVAYGTVSRYNAVFTLSAPFYPVSAVADPAYTAPIHMYYGTTDPNYATDHAYLALQQQWNALGVTWESDIETGWGHDFWPPLSMLLGFQFLVGKTYVSCAGDANHACLQQGRYRIGLTWQDAGGRTGVGSPVPGAVSP